MLYPNYIKKRWLIIEIHALKIDEVLNSIQHLDLFYELISEERLSEIQQKRLDRDKYTYLVSEIFSLYVLSKKFDTHLTHKDLSKSINGKKYVNKKFNRQVYFNITHSYEWIFIAISEFEIGIDLEKIREINYMDISKNFFHAIEVKNLSLEDRQNQLKYFYRVWTSKESYLKMIGSGLKKPMNSFYIELNNHCIQKKITHFKGHLKFTETLSLITITFDTGYVLSICSKEDDTVKKVEFMKSSEFIKNIINMYLRRRNNEFEL